MKKLVIGTVSVLCGLFCYTASNAAVNLTSEMTKQLRNQPAHSSEFSGLIYGGQDISRPKVVSANEVRTNKLVI